MTQSMGYEIDEVMQQAGDTGGAAGSMVMGEDSPDFA